MRRANTDPWIHSVQDGDLEGVLEQVPQVLTAADGIWQERRQNPKYVRPAPAPRPPAAARAARAAPAPAVPAAPAGPQMTPMF